MPIDGIETRGMGRGGQVRAMRPEECRRLPSGKGIASASRGRPGKPLRAATPSVACKGGGKTMPDNQTANDTLLDRKVSITVTPTLIWHSDSNIEATFSVSQTSGEPAAMNGRVASNGAIDLTGMPNDPLYSDNIDVTITLDDSQMVDPNGNHIAGRWATATEGSGDGKAVGFGWFCGVDANGNYDPWTPITIPAMSISRLSDTQLLINDDTPDAGPAYNYCMGLVLSGHNDYYITLDPRITSKTPGTTTFMLNNGKSC